jgi:hypothetical protein
MQEKYEFAKKTSTLSRFGDRGNPWFFLVELKGGFSERGLMPAFKPL